MITSYSLIPINAIPIEGVGLGGPGGDLLANDGRLFGLHAHFPICNLCVHDGEFVFLTRIIGYCLL
jgi:hypothetical protein